MLLVILLGMQFCIEHDVLLGTTWLLVGITLAIYISRARGGPITKLSRPFLKEVVDGKTTFSSGT
jgi:hypothetical protein